MDLKDKVVWITGGAKRLGRAMALDLAGRGAHLALHYRSSEDAARAVASEIEALGRRALLVQADLARVEQIEPMAAEIEAAFGRLDVFINSASNFLRVPLEEITEADWHASIDVNLKGPTFCALAAARLMRKGGRGGKIINFADSAALRPYRNFLPYMISKGGVVTMTQALALELAADDIQVNAVAPGPVLLPEGATEEQKKKAIERVPMGRAGSPQDIVNAVAYLIEGADYVTGQVLCVDGGRIISTI